MITKKEFYFIRHGQTDGNLPPNIRKNYGDISLNAVGVSQAMAVESIISSLPIRTVCCSPLKRAKETRDLCCANLASAHIEIQDLSECDAATWGPMTALGALAIHSLDQPIYSFMERVRSGVNEALSKEGPILIVAHGGIHWALCCHLQVEHEWAIDNCVPVHFFLSETGVWQARKITHFHVG